MSKNNIKLTIASIALCAIPYAAQSADNKMDIYGKIHMSADSVQFADSDDFLISSNSSRLGFKGSTPLEHDLTGIWKIESEIDISGETSDIGARNRYVGLKHAYGTLLSGYHDTPFKTLGGRAGVFHDTVAERRGILGAGNGDNKFNIRGKNSVMYISPKLYDTEIRIMRSTGDDTSKSVDEYPVTSASVLFDKKMFYIGFAYEDQSKPTVDGTGMRYQAGLNMHGLGLNVIYEVLSSDANTKFDRNAFGGSLTYKLGKIKLKAQLFIAEENSAQDDTGAILTALGADYSLGKAFNLYAVYASVENDAAATAPLAGSGHGEKYTPVAAGDDLSAISVGAVYKF